MASNTLEAVPVIEGWFTLDDQPQLLGNRCTSCNTPFFPKQSAFCPNPDCRGDTFEDIPLSRTGKLWSFTNSCYPPPAPYVAGENFEPYAIAAVELDAEKIIVLGQVVKGIHVEALAIGQSMEMVVETLFIDDDKRQLGWKWRPITS